MKRLIKRFEKHISTACRIRPGLYEGWLWGNEIRLEKFRDKWNLTITPYPVGDDRRKDGEPRFLTETKTFRTMREAEQYLTREYGQEQVNTYNLLNKAAGKFKQARSTDICCDPSSETYWSM